MSQNVTTYFVKLEIWNSFKSRFKSPTSEASYKSDILEFCRFTEKDFDETLSIDVQNYYEHLRLKVKKGMISTLTMTKKFRELHSLSHFIIEEFSDQVSLNEDYFYQYLKLLDKEKEFARSIPIEHMDKLLQAASIDLNVYTMLVFMYRVGLSSTEIISLKSDHQFLVYDNGIYFYVGDRREPCYIPGDAWQIILKYLQSREDHEFLFYNRSGNPLNTMYISRMMKKYCALAGIPSYSAEALRNCCAYNLFAYGATDKEVAEQMGRTTHQIKRYKGMSYKKGLNKRSAELVKIQVKLPSE